ncbi:MAG TPA: SGNH/GDSL hydrolase family protein [Verrucomicrobiae bacterium]|jgi:hypothetical protein
MDAASSIGKKLGAWLCVFFLAFAARARETAPWERVVIIGASVSHGFTFAEPLGGPRTKELAFDRFFDAAIIAPHEPVKNFASAMFFIIPDDAGHEQIRQALTNNPTLVVGVDFLFWFCYGVGETDQERAAHFERGLKLLEELKCPLIVGDIPDASAARNRALKPSEFPSAKARLAANRRLMEWAAPRKQVTVVPASEFMSIAAENRALTVRGLTIAEGKTRALLQGDCLHPNRRGNAMLALSILDSFLSAHPGMDASTVRWEPEKVLALAGHN